jgi:hypothetical protein
MSDIPHKGENPADTLARLRKRIVGGSSLLLDSLTNAELVAMQDLILKGEAEIVSSACKPFLIAKLDRVIIS